MFIGPKVDKVKKVFHDKVKTGGQSSHKPTFLTAVKHRLTRWETVGDGQN
jgi:hypothetical protein